VESAGTVWAAGVHHGGCAPVHTTHNAQCTVRRMHDGNGECVGCECEPWVSTSSSSSGALHLPNERCVLIGSNCDHVGDTGKPHDTS
jgi:hypothetical protein